MELLKKLIETPSPTGREGAIANLFIEELPEGTGTIDAINNAYYLQGSSNLLLSAHHDEIAFAVSYIEESGLIRIMKTSGEDPRVLPGLRLEVITDNGDLVKGIVCMRPIHVVETEDRNTLPKLETLALEVGATSREDVEKMGIHIGSPVIFERSFLTLGDLIIAPGLDDKIGVYIVMEVLKQCKEVNQIAGCLMAAEETGTRGAKVAARKLNPLHSLDFDVTFTTDDGSGLSPARFGGEVKLGAGPIIEYGPDKSAKGCDFLIDLAKQNDIPYQIAVSRAGGTNTARIQEFSDNGCLCNLLSIPCRNLHQPNEIVSKKDVEAAIKLSVLWTKALGTKD